MKLNPLLELKEISPDFFQVFLFLEPLNFFILGDERKLDGYDQRGISMIIQSLFINDVCLIEVKGIIYFYEEFRNVNFVLPFAEIHDFFIKGPSSNSPTI
jgi:hypothetical protein